MKILVSFVLLCLVASGFAQTLCRTPNNEEALCISVHRCPLLKKAYSNPSQDVQRFLRESECGYDNSPWVCCGRVAKFQSLESITATPPPVRTTPRSAPAAYNVLPSTRDPKQHRNVGLLPTGKQCGVQIAGENIVGGNETQLDEFPWMALLEYGRNGSSSGFYCGGMLINNRYVLTAAHCVTGLLISFVGDLISLRLGEHDTNKTTDCQSRREGADVIEECNVHQDIIVEKFIVHPEFNLTGESFNDIALVRLIHPVVYKYHIQPICMPLNGEKSAPGDKLDIAGWGRTENKTTSNVKLKTKVPVVPLEDCRKTYKLVKRRLTEQQFCAGGIKGFDSCTGDSGGPIMALMPNAKPRRWYAEGIVSYGPIDCGLHGWPGVYTRVSSYMDWVLDNMKP